MDKRKIVKGATSLVIGAGIAKIITAFVQNNVDFKGIADKVSITGASFVVGTMVTDLSKGYTDDKIDDFFDWYEGNGKLRELFDSIKGSIKNRVSK